MGLEREKVGWSWLMEGENQPQPSTIDCDKKDARSEIEVLSHTGLKIYVPLFCIIFFKKIMVWGNIALHSRRPF